MAVVRNVSLFTQYAVDINSPKTWFCTDHPQEFLIRRMFNGAETAKSDVHYSHCRICVRISLLEARYKVLKKHGVTMDKIAPKAKVRGVQGRVVADPSQKRIHGL